MSRDAIVIGAGIAGMATARSLSLKGYKVTVLEKGEWATGASIRNFGMVWPVGQPAGTMYETALHSRAIWKELCTAGNIWYEEAGSLHLAYREDEWNVLQEFAASAKQERACTLLSAAETATRSPAVVTSGLQGALWSPDELIIESREAIKQLPQILSEKFGIRFLFKKAVTAIRYPVVEAGTDRFQADLVVVCSGADIELLYPDLYAASPVTRCKLQMMRMTAQPDGLRIGPALCGPLTLAHYGSFAGTPSLPALKERFVREFPDHLRWGIHVMVAQNGAGELTVGDSHEYGFTHDPFDKEFINKLILGYLKSFARFPDEHIIQTWNGVYNKMTDGSSFLLQNPEPGVFVFNGLGGAGMTLSFGLSEKLFSSL